MSKRALVLGLGESGEAAARLLRAEGAAVMAADGVDTPALREKAGRLSAEGIEVALGANPLPCGAFDLAVVSPGLPPASPWLQEVKRRGIPAISELELGWSRRSCRVVAVTGSNGKSTAVKWLAEALQQAGLRAMPAGNYGAAICRVVREQPGLDWLVLEVSSFQLETVDAFRPEVGVLLNILPNHLDRHGSMESYAALKARLFARTLPSDTCLVPAARRDEVRALSGGAGRWLAFGAGPESDYRWREGRVWRGGAACADLRGTRFDNDVLGPAAAAVVAAAEACGADAACAERAARDFQPLPHRMQKVAEGWGVWFVDDSKATNVAAMVAALRMAGRPVRLVAGGLAKETDFRPAREVLREFARGVYLVGHAAEAMRRAWSDAVPCVLCGTVDEAVRRAAKEAAAGETVLLSPACTSYDQYKNYGERGEHFARCARAVAEGA
ncbi:MAG TPA: UDP-N-acetylmuramoyl-L-alanine--D-glutamate ligase [Kiritimatiellia bacterium]|nr:UDP-N-acetylmuramoyl-L-alanine--D-glutamate ligase [Kiritimatiellia bacterium]HRZ13775.1 UDP-N-acetylmuramoyl-L-alanine--D-glutamate ligase [Kiritimatiellia bacterium]HSA19714.1 UDP-N-acetylmuramoyl-L-alanine--D-glutamate ligase [Kiritimatiellia bacterium]